MKRIFLLLIILYVSEEKSNAQEKWGGFVINNGTVEGGDPSSPFPTGWRSVVGLDSKGYVIHTMQWTDEISYSGSRSLKISNSKMHSETSSWSYEISLDLPVGKDITLEAKIKGNLSGQGAGLMIRADDSSPAFGDPEQIATTKESSITGNFDWTSYRVVLKDLGEMKSVTIYLIFLPDTTGEVFFDDITVR